MLKTVDMTDLGWAVLDTLDGNVAVLNRTGDIIAVNASWQAFHPIIAGTDPDAVLG